MTFTSEPGEFSCLATMELESYTTESGFFSNMLQSQIVVNPFADYDPPAGDEVYLTDELVPIGPALLLPVGKGDSIYFEAYANFDGVTGYSNTLPVGTMTTMLDNLFTGINATNELPRAVSDIVNDIFGSGFGAIGVGAGDNVPAAYLNYLAAESGPENLAHQMTADFTGYLVVYLSNESNSSTSSNAVYWDDLRIERTW